MPRLIYSPPKYRLHRPSGQAVVNLNGNDIYLGKYNTAASRAEYMRLVAEWTANNSTRPQKNDSTVAELLAAFLRHAERYYVRPDGTQTIFDSRPQLLSVFAVTPRNTAASVTVKYCWRFCMLRWPCPIGSATTYKSLSNFGSSRKHRRRQQVQRVLRRAGLG